MIKSCFGVVIALFIALAGCGPAEDDGFITSNTSALTISDYVYEHSATGTVADLNGDGSLSIDEKTAAVDSAIDKLVAQAGQMPGISAAVGKDPNGNPADRFPFPSVEHRDPMTGQLLDEWAGKNVEFRFVNDAWMLKVTNEANTVALPWTVGVFTTGNKVNVVIGSPETFVRLYFRGANNMNVLLKAAKQHHIKLRSLVDGALKNHEFTTKINQGWTGTLMDETTIAGIETQMGQPITPEFIAPSMTLSGTTVDQVKDQIAAAVAASGAPPWLIIDLDNDGQPDPGYENIKGNAVLPTVFTMYMTGQIDFNTMAGMMGMGFYVWNAPPKGGTFQAWKAPRVVELSHHLTGKAYQFELCQPFYARAALSTGMHHIPSMPCHITVWDEGGKVRVSVLDPTFIFAYFFADALPSMPTAMKQLFSVFPILVFNDLATIANNAMIDLGLPQRITLHNFP
jgi:hypothetical protein